MTLSLLSRCVERQLSAEKSKFDAMFRARGGFNELIAPAPGLPARLVKRADVNGITLVQSGKAA
jgi:hypothetical protein